MTDYRDAPEVAVGSVWFVWGEHQRVIEERLNDVFGEREVVLVPVGKKRAKGYGWVAAWRVARKGEPSLYHSNEGSAQ